MSAAVQQLQVYSVAAYFGVGRLVLQTGLVPLEDFSAYPATVKPIVLAHASQTRYYSAAWRICGLAESLHKWAPPPSQLSYGKLPLVVLSKDFHATSQRRESRRQPNGMFTAGYRLTFFQQSAQRRAAHGHYSHLDRPDFAIAAIQSVWQQAR